MSSGWGDFRIVPTRGGDGLKAAYLLIGLIALLGVLGMFSGSASWQAFGSSPAYDFQYWRPVLFALTSSGIVQLLICCLVLYLIVPGLEKDIGWTPTLTVFGLSGLGAATALALVGPPASMSGAIFAVYGVIAAQAVVKHHAQADIKADIVLLALMVAYNLLVGAPDWMGGVGGIIAGAIAGAVYAWSPYRGRRSRLATGFVSIGVACLIVITATWLA